MIAADLPIPRVWAIVPVKRLSLAKQRLAPVLTDGLRATLALAMLADLFELLRELPFLAGIAVVSNDARVRAMAPAGALLLNDPTESGTNSAVQHGLRMVEPLHSDALMILPSDIPFAQASELLKVAQALENESLIIVPDRRGVGTNLLAGYRFDAMDTSFGVDSFKRHVSNAMAIGMRPRVLEFPGIGWDVDLPEDLHVDEVLSCYSSGRHTRAFLSRIAVSA